VYLDLIFTAPEGAERDNAYDLYSLTLTDTYGHEFAYGMNLSADIDKTDWPKVVLHHMIGVDKLPESITLTLDGDAVVTR